MKKLVKANTNRKDSIEAYGCTCTCPCYGSTNKVTQAVGNSASKAIKYLFYSKMLLGGKCYEKAD